MRGVGALLGAAAARRGPVPTRRSRTTPPPCNCLVQVSYAIGVPDPLSVFVDTYGTGTKSDSDILALLLKKFDFRPGLMARALDLKRGTSSSGKGRYIHTAAYGHFGRDDLPDVFTWEKVVPLLD